MTLPWLGLCVALYDAYEACLRCAVLDLLNINSSLFIIASFLLALPHNKKTFAAQSSFRSRNDSTAFNPLS